MDREPTRKSRGWLGTIGIAVGIYLLHRHFIAPHIDEWFPEPSSVVRHSRTVPGRLGDVPVSPERFQEIVDRKNQMTQPQFDIWIKERVMGKKVDGMGVWFRWSRIRPVA